MVLEDDVLLSSRLPNLLSSIDGLNPDEVDIVRLETTRSVGRFGRSKTLENFTLRRVMQPQFCSGAYIIYPKAAEYLLTEIHGNPSNTPVDLVLFDRPSIFQLGIWQALPGLAVQPEFLPAAASAMPHHLSSLSNERVAVIEVAGLGRSTFYERAANWGRLLGRYSLEDLFAFRKARSVEYQP
jgi:GR25 family glycosyltransferase involved in LPS biosynthesis